MSDAPSTLPRRRSPFTSHTAQARPDARGLTGVRLLATMLPGVTQVSTWISGIGGLEAALEPALACKPPARTGQAAVSALGLILRTGPEEFLILSDEGARTEAILRQVVTPDIGAVLDLTHARSRIRISGERCLETLAKLYALDLRAGAFPVGEARLSGHHHVPCLLHRIEPACFDLIIFTTYALDQLEAIEDAALEFGVAVELRDD